MTMLVNIASGKKVNIKSFSFYHRVSGTGYRHWKMYINGIEVGDSTLYAPTTGGTGANTLQATGTKTVRNAVNDLTGSITVLFKLYDHDPASPHGNAGGTLARRWNLDPKPNIAISYYAVFSNNPIKFTDSQGDSINVAEKYRDSFTGALESVFGDKAYCFGYTDNGNLIYNGNVKQFSKEELSVYNKMNLVMKAKDVTKIVYEASLDITDKNNKTYSLNAASRGGEATATMKDFPSFKENYIVIDPKLTSPILVMEVTENYYKTKGKPLPYDPNNPPNYVDNANVEITVQNATFHAIGHVIYAGQPQQNVLDFDNETRALNKSKTSNNSLTPAPLPARKPDAEHNKLVINGTGGNITEAEK